MNNGNLADVVIVCAGAKEAVNDALNSVDRNGTIIFFAVPSEDIALPSVRFWRDEMTVSFSYGAAPEDLCDSMQLIGGNKINVRKMITHTLPFSEIQEGFKLVSEGKRSLKVVMVPDAPKG